MAIYGQIRKVFQNLTHSRVNQEKILTFVTKFSTFVAHFSLHNHDVAYIPKHFRVLMTKKRVQTLHQFSTLFAHFSARNVDIAHFYMLMTHITLLPPDVI